ncbi:MAG: enoyl-CoA hydratase/isomerase family protein [Deltaproteobacteria bacterium]|nr:enoyl-CoA hydratase/isomerase family protein [Deltaproteobacteria bacterium]
MYQDILVEKGPDFVAEISFNRPERLNTFTTVTARELYEALAEFEADPEVRVIVIKGQGRAFCAGIDLGEFFGQSATSYKTWVEGMELPLAYISEMNKPVIASVKGVAAANGGGLVAAADLAICSERARIGYTAVNVGLFCLGPAVPLARVLGRKRSLELLLYGELITAQKALEMGLVNRVVPDDELEQATREWAVSLAARSPLAVQMGKRAFYAMSDMDYQTSFEYMNEVFARLCTTKDAEEGVKAFKEKRDPVYRGE